MAKLKKLSNLKAHEVSLVQRGANKKPFLIFKSEDGQPARKPSDVLALTHEQEERIVAMVEGHANRVAKAGDLAPLSKQTQAALVACYRILLPVRDQITEGMIDELVAELDPVEDDEADAVDDSEVGNDIDQPERIDMQTNVQKGGPGSGPHKGGGSGGIEGNASRAKDSANRAQRASTEASSSFSHVDPGERKSTAQSAHADASRLHGIAAADAKAAGDHEAASYHDRQAASHAGSAKSLDRSIRRGSSANKAAGDGEEDDDNMGKKKFDPEEQFSKAAGDWKKPDDMDEKKFARAAKAAKDAFGKACKADEQDDDEDEDEDEVEKSAVAKSALDGLPAEARAYFESVRKADRQANRALVQKAASLEAEMRAIKGEAVLKSYEDRVTSEFPALSIDAKETAQVLKSLADTNMAAHDHYLETLRQAHEQVKGSGIYKSVGHSPGANSRNSGFVAKATGGSAETRLNALVAGYVAKGEVADESAAWTKAMQTEEGIRLYEQRAVEQGGF